MRDIGKTGIIPFTYFGGKQKPVGSSFLRVDFLTNYSTDFEKYIHGKKYDNLIFQKAYWKDMMRLFSGPMILDLCDPDWHRESLNIKEIGDLVHGITCSSEKLTRLIRNYFPNKIIEYVPDRINPVFFPSPRKKHVNKAEKIVWFGFIHNAYETLSKLAPTLKQHKLSLDIISDTPYSNKDEILDLKPTFIKYEQKNVYSLLKKYDIVLNPKSEKALYKYKSENKSLIAWKLGVSVATTSQEFEDLLSPHRRNEQVIKKQQVIEKKYLINKSAEQYRNMIIKIRKNLL